MFSKKSTRFPFRPSSSAETVVYWAGTVPKKRRETGILYGTAEISAFFLSREVYYTMGPRTFQRGF